MFWFPILKFYDDTFTNRFPHFQMRFLANLAPRHNFNRVSLHIIKRGNRIKECLREDYGLAEEIKNRTLILDLSLGLTIFFHPFLSQSIILAFHFFSLSLSLFSFHPCYIPPFHFSCHFLNCWSMHDFPRPESRVFSFAPMLPTQILDSLETL